MSLIIGWVGLIAENGLKTGLITGSVIGTTTGSAIGRIVGSAIGDGSLVRAPVKTTRFCRCLGITLEHLISL